MFRSASHYVQRSRELGLRGTLRRVWMRVISKILVWGQSLWWGWMARQEMSDAGLLARTTGRWHSVDALLHHLALRPSSSFLLPHGSPQKTALLLQQYYPEYVSSLFETANSICENELSLLGQTFCFSEGIDWNTDPVTGWRFPLLHWRRVSEYLGSSRPVDLIVFWEMNRHQHFITLGIAYCLTGNQRYVDAFCSQIQNWIENNPLQHGVNWYYGLEISIRLLAWTVAFQFFRNSQKFCETVGNIFLKSLWQQADFLSNHLQNRRNKIDIPNNHLIAELTGLALVGTAFPEFTKAAAWQETSLQWLNEQVVAQTHSDGVNKEQATGYHRFIAELLLLVVARSRQGAFPMQPLLEETLAGMLDYVVYSLSPVGTAPMWGDWDYGRALGLGKDKDFWDFRPLLSTGAVLFDRSDWKFAAGRFDEEAFWLLGFDGLEHWERLETHQPAQTSRAYPNGGVYIIRDRWDAKTDLAIFRCGPFGLGGEGHCAHAHCDLLSVLLWVDGQPLLVDSGTYIYHGPFRNYFRLTAAHNTVKVDGREQAIPMPNFNWTQISNASRIEWTGEQVTGTMIYPDGTQLIRELAHPRPGSWELVDKLAGLGAHEMEWFFHFAPGLELEIDERENMLTVFREGRSFLTLQMPNHGVRFQVGNSWFSYQYGLKQANRELVAYWQEKLEGGTSSFRWLFQLISKNC